MVTELSKNMKVLRNRFNFDSEKHSGCMKNKSNKKKMPILDEKENSIL